MIHSTKKDLYWSFGCQGVSNHQEQYSIFDEIVEAIEAAEVLRPGKSLLRTSESSMSINSALFGCFEKKKKLGRITKYHVEF